MRGFRVGPAEGFGRVAIYQAGSDRYADSYLPTRAPVGTPEQALDTVCGLYLGDPPPASPINPRRTNAVLYQ